MTESHLEKVGAETPRPTPARAPRKRSTGKGVPDGAKRPQDHQPAKNDTKDELALVPVEWGTKPGEPDDEGNPTERVPATYDIDLMIFDDIEFVEAMIDMDAARNDQARSVHAFKALRRLLGDDQFEEYKDNSRDPKTGRTSFVDAIGLFNHITKEVKQGNF